GKRMIALEDLGEEIAESERVINELRRQKEVLELKVNEARKVGTIGIVQGKPEEARIQNKLDIEGILLPVKRVQLYAPMEGKIIAIPPDIKAGCQVYKGQELLRLYSNNALPDPGEFAVKSPMDGILLSSDFRESLLNKHVKPGALLL